MKLSRPTLLLDSKKCRINIESMATKARSSGIVFRPHFKTHQSEAVGAWFKEYDVEKITVSSVAMAEYFAQNGWNDILVAFPVNILEIGAINHLAEKISLHLLVESVFSASFLAQNLSHPAGVYLKIDTGNHRTGLSPGNLPEIRQIIETITRSDRMTFTGFLAHDGHTYRVGSREDVVSIHRQSVKLLNRLKEQIETTFKEPIRSLGDTPSCSIIEHFEDIDEVRPGNFIFYDLMQYELGACSLQDIAVAVACPVVAIHTNRNEIVIHGGAVHLSKEYLEKQGHKQYGLVVPLSDNTWGAPYRGCYVAGLSQEHGIIRASAELMEVVRIGDVVGILPVHSCLTASLFREYYLMDGIRIENIHS